MTTPIESLRVARELLADAIEKQNVGLIVSLCAVIKKLVLTNFKLGLANGSLVETKAMTTFIMETVHECAEHLKANGLSEEETGDIIDQNINTLLERTT